MAGSIGRLSEKICTPLRVARINWFAREIAQAHFNQRRDVLLPFHFYPKPIEIYEDSQSRICVLNSYPERDERNSLHNPYTNPHQTG